MFKNVFQGGSYVEVFSAQGRDPVSKWRLCGTSSAIRKVYDKDVRSYVYILEGESTTTKMCLPKDDKQSLFLIQRYLIVQLFVPLGHSFSLEFGVSDMGNNKRRVFLSSSHKEINVTPLHARFPLSILRLGVWLDLCLDLQSLVGNSFKGQTFKSIESLSISAHCRLRKIFTMKSQPPDTTDDDDIYGCESTNSAELEEIPRQFQMSPLPDVQHYTQVLTMTKLRQADLKNREALGLPPPVTPGPADADTGTKHGEKPTHIAFGSKIVIPPHARKSSSRDGSTSAGGRHSQSSLYHSSFNRSGSVPILRSVSPSADGEGSRETLKSGRSPPQMRANNETSDSNKPQLGVEAVQTTIQPRPPRTGSGSKPRRRPVRVKGSSISRVGNEHSKESSQTESGLNNVNDSNSNQHTDRRTTSESETDVSHSGTISRSASESSLKFSGNESLLGESFGKLSINSNKSEGHEIKERNRELKEKDYKNKLSVKSDDLPSNSKMFTFSSRPRSAPRSPRQRRKKTQDNSASSSAENKPDIKITEVELNGHVQVSKPRSRKGSDKEYYDDDFCRVSGESSEEEDGVQKLFRTSNSSTRSGSKSPKLSPLESPRSSSPPATPHCKLRASIKSSLLKEIPSPKLNKSYNAKNYQSDASSWRNYQSDASSWRFDMSGTANSFLDKSLNQLFGDRCFPHKHFSAEGSGSSGEGLLVNDGDSSDESDETSFSTWKPPLPPNKAHHYQDEMKHPGPEPDLTATLPMDPRVYTNVFSPPIPLPSEKNNTAGTSNPLIPIVSSLASPPRSRNTSMTEQQPQSPGVESEAEPELDLLYDPCLNCYFDPKTHKYYELA